jgi:hypothetical protein
MHLLQEPPGRAEYRSCQSHPSEGLSMAFGGTPPPFPGSPFPGQPPACAPAEPPLQECSSPPIPGKEMADSHQSEPKTCFSPNNGVIFSGNSVICAGKTGNRSLKQPPLTSPPAPPPTSPISGEDPVFREKEPAAGTPAGSTAAAPSATGWQEKVQYQPGDEQRDERDHAADIHECIDGYAFHGNAHDPLKVSGVINTRGITGDSP